jgi:UDP-N-acetylmuramate dehydrogenase
MDFHPNILLKNFTTMRLGGPALFLAEARTPQEVADIYHQAKSQSLPVFVLGGGSNVIANDNGFQGIILRMRIPGFEVISDDLNSTTIKIGAGEIWDDVVKRIVDMHLSGVEALSAIPGTTGAGPVQNIGAYGQEIADTLQSLEAYDSRTDSFVTLQSADCEFSYRDSIFRGREAGRYVITSVTLTLSKTIPQPPFYDAVQKYFDEHNIHSFSQEIIRNAVVDIRTNKLPDPKLLPNTGSFFKNAIVDKWKVDELRATYPDMPAYEMGDSKYKLSSGWLIEHAGLKGIVLHGMRVHDKNSLVLINESATSYNDLAKAREEIIGKVRDTFGVQIEQEPLEI